MSPTERGHRASNQTRRGDRAPLPCGFSHRACGTSAGGKPWVTVLVLSQPTCLGGRVHGDGSLFTGPLFAPAWACGNGLSLPLREAGAAPKEPQSAMTVLGVCGTVLPRLCHQRRKAALKTTFN